MLNGKILEPFGKVKDAVVGMKAAVSDPAKLSEAMEKLEAVVVEVLGLSDFKEQLDELISPVMGKLKNVMEQAAKKMEAYVETLKAQLIETLESMAGDVGKKLATVQCFVAKVVGTISQVHDKVDQMIADLEENFAPLHKVVADLMELPSPEDVAEIFQGKMSKR